ncbi:MAG: PEGA domain-containing protein [Myxococcales bacterium]|nr:PEGA domain-containing protein [Myxococcales bacterium]
MEVTRSLSRLAALFVACAVLFSPTPSFADGSKADDQAEARTRYKKGLDLYEEGAFDAALTELQRAYDLAPSYKILYNISLVYLQINDHAGALRSFKKYLADGGKKVDQKRRAEIDKEIAKLQTRVASVDVKVNVDGAQVSLDDLEVGETPLDQPLTVNAGKRKISVSKSGYATVNKVVVVAGGDKSSLTLELRQGSSPATPQTGGVTKPRPSTPEKKRPEADSGREIPWLWWGVTGGLATGTAVFGVLALGAQNDLDAKKKHPASKQSLDDSASKTRTLAIVTDVFLVGTLAVGGYASYLTFIKSPDDPKHDKSATNVVVGVGPGSVSVAGTF